MNKLILVLTFLSTLLPIIAEEALLSKHNQAILSPLQEVLQTSSVVIMGENNLSIGYGCLMSKEGHVFTKASTIEGQKKVVLRHGREKYTANLLEVSPEWDVALLKFQLKDGVPLELSAPPASVGHIVVSNGVTSLLERRLKFGVIAANTRSIVFQESALDLLAYPSEDEKAFMVKSIKPGGLAEKAGVKENDLITEINGVAIADFTVSFGSLFHGKWPGEEVSLTMKRGEETLKFTLTLQWLHEVNPGPQNRNEGMSGRISVRRTGFPMVLQHDIPLSTRTVGGPLLDLEGKCIGMNIARFSRSETYAIPSNMMLKLAEEWDIPQ